MAMLLGMSISLGGIGGLLSGILSYSLLRALLWATGFGVLEALLVIMTTTSRLHAPIFIPIALFWSLVGWLVIGRVFQRRRVKEIAKRVAPER